MTATGINCEVAVFGSYEMLIPLTNEQEYMPAHNGCQIIFAGRANATKY
jgi:hypothetical protein